MNSDELDRILDEALASYSAREPRAGLAGRVLARVAADRGRSRMPWFLAVAAALAAAVIVLMMWPGEVPRPEPLAWAPPPPPSVPSRRPDAPRPARHPRPPSLETLPGPSPMTAEERALLAFARQAPQAALEMAKADQPLEIKPIEIRPLVIDGLSTGENK